MAQDEEAELCLEERDVDCKYIGSESAPAGDAHAAQSSSNSSGLMYSELNEPVLVGEAQSSSSASCKVVQFAMGAQIELKKTRGRVRQ